MANTSHALGRVLNFLENKPNEQVHCMFLTNYQLQKLADHLISKNINGIAFMIGQSMNPITNQIDEYFVESIPINCSLDCGNNVINYVVNEGTIGGLNVNLPKVNQGCDVILKNDNGGGGPGPNQHTHPPGVG
jgi:hypothetical protein